MNSTDYFNLQSDAIEKQIASAICAGFDGSQIPDDKWDKDTWWTNQIKSILVAIGRSNQFMVACAGVASDHCEWKYDLMWWEETDEGGRCKLTNVPLVVESEWNLRLHAIQYDFEKLIVARAERRMMVFNVFRPDDARNYIDFLKSIVISYKLSQVNDRYIFAVWIQSTKEFYFDSYVHVN